MLDITRVEKWTREGAHNVLKLGKIASNEWGKQEPVLSALGVIA